VRPLLSALSVLAIVAALLAGRLGAQTQATLDTDRRAPVARGSRLSTEGDAAHHANLFHDMAPAQFDSALSSNEYEARSWRASDAEATMTLSLARDWRRSVIAHRQLSRDTGPSSLARLELSALSNCAGAMS